MSEDVVRIKVSHEIHLKEQTSKYGNCNIGHSLTIELPLDVSAEDLISAIKKEQKKNRVLTLREFDQFKSNFDDIPQEDLLPPWPVDQI